MKNICHCQCAIVIYYVSMCYIFFGADRCSENGAKDSSYDIRIPCSYGIRIPCSYDIRIGCSYDIRIGCSYDIRIGYSYDIKIGCSNGIKTAIVDE